MTPRIVLADDHALIRFGLRALLEMSGMEVAGEAGEGREALRLVQELAPDVAIFDLSMPGLNGIEATAMLTERGAGTRVLILSMHSNAEHVHRAFAAGAAGYLLKGSASEDIVEAVRTVLVGRRYLSRELGHLGSPPPAGTAAAGPIERLSMREREVLQLVVEGHSSSSIAAMVNLSPKSVDTYRSRIMQKLGVRDLPGLVRFAIEHGMTPGS